MAEQDATALAPTADALLEHERRARELSEERLARVERIAKVGSWEWNLVPQQLSWSDEIYRIFDLSRAAELTFDAIVALTHPEDRAKNQTFVDRLLGGADQAELLFRVLLPDGTIKHVHQHAELRRDAAGAPEVVFGTMQDVTERKLASLGALAAEVAHEINNPLTYVIYNLTSLEGELPRQASRLAEVRTALSGCLGEARLRELLGDNIDVLDPAKVVDAEERFRDALIGARRIKDIVRGLGLAIRLPVATAAAAGTKAVSAQAREVPVVAGRVLVIDDEPGIRAALRRILRAHEVVETDSGERARELLAGDQRFDVILCDMMMPRVSGIDVHKWLCAQHPELARKLVFVTGGAFTPSAQRYLDQVDNVRVAKPFDASRLEKLVDEWVSASQAKQ